MPFLQSQRSRGFAVLSILAALTVVYAGVTGQVYVKQREFIYSPTKLQAGELKELARETFGPETRVMDPFDAVVVEPPALEASSGVAIWFHGSAGLNVDRYGVPRRLAARGYRAVMAEYPGFGERAGDISEQALVEDAVALYEAVAKENPGQPITLFGESLGSGVATQVAARAAAGKLQGPAPKRLVLLTPFDSLEAAAMRSMWYLPVRWLIKDRFDSVTAVRQYHGPVDILAAERDKVVGEKAATYLERAARTRSSGARVTLKVLPGAGHIDWWDRMTEKDWDEVMGETVYPQLMTQLPLNKPRTYIF